jgi:hypothetical protein
MRYAGNDIYSCMAFHDDRFRHSNNITSTIGEATVLILLIGGIYEARH